MMIHNDLRTVIACLLFACATPCSAQSLSAPVAEPDIEMQLNETLQALQDRLAPLSEAADIPLPLLETRLRPLFQEAIPRRADDGKTWAFRFDFDTHEAISLDGAALEAHPDGWAVFDSASACQAAFPQSGDVVHFQRYRKELLIGHMCAQRLSDGSASTLIARTLIESPDRRFWATYQMGAAISRFPEELNLLFDPVVEANIAVALEITDIGIEGLDH